MNKEELIILPTPQGTSHCSCLEHCFLFWMHLRCTLGSISPQNVLQIWSVVTSAERFRGPFLSPSHREPNHPSPQEQLHESELYCPSFAQLRAREHSALWFENKFFLKIRQHARVKIASAVGHSQTMFRFTHHKLSPCRVDKYLKPVRDLSLPVLRAPEFIRQLFC